MTRYAITIEYRGTHFHGFQKQPGLPTVQGALENALLTFTGEETVVQGAGRTDAGVHAVGQAVAFEVPGGLNTGKATRGLNALLPPGVAITAMRAVRDDFDPRRDAIWREYRYFILN
ncbi:MAG: tRNA pseudouridine(38-40) synthase TruA, partial [Actinobacteria bacterium]|nr:tRNA pseudouridine(38-40) synthase TruA [Actinomycetota bacterium]